MSGSSTSQLGMESQPPVHLHNTPLGLGLMEQQETKNVCARCCLPLTLKQARWNYVFWGMAHKRCRAKAVWPPVFRPDLDPNEILRQVYALCAHLAKMASGMPLPQILPHKASPIPVGDEGVELVSSREEREEKFSSPRNTPPSSDDEQPTQTPSKQRPRMPYERRRKKRAAPQPSPHATPSPKPKDMRLAEKDQRKSNATTPTQPPTNTQQPPTATQQPLTVTQQPPAVTTNYEEVSQQGNLGFCGQKPKHNARVFSPESRPSRTERHIYRG